MPARAEFRKFLRERLETFSTVFLLPLFFAFTGLRTQVALLGDAEGWLLCAGIIAVAIAGKLGGSMLAARAAGIAWRDSLAIGTLMNAWRRLGRPVPLYIAGDGPQAASVKEFVGKTDRCHWLGWQPKEAVAELLRNATCLIVPSECYETFGLVIAEAYAAGLPVVGSRLGSIGAAIDDRRTGLHANPGDPGDLAAKVEWVFSHPHERAEMRAHARAEFEAKYTAERNHQMLTEIYDQVRSVAAR